jgi:Cof subfamily protein (haloacid dehalogenase superfamily)
MDLVVFDLDGTLLNAQSQISDYTNRVLTKMAEAGIAYTVATGRTLHGAHAVVSGSGFHLPHIIKNGVLIWNPASGDYSRQCLLTQEEISQVLLAFTDAGVSPFIHTFEPNEHHGVYHAPVMKDYEHKLAAFIERERGSALKPLSAMPPRAPIANFSGLGSQEAIDAIVAQIAQEEHLIAYGGPAFEGQNLYWLDVHHCDGNKGAAVLELKRDMGAERIICFGDSDNDLTMFEIADECYAPDNAKPEVKAVATEVIGHHDDDGIARFLEARFDL